MAGISSLASTLLGGKQSGESAYRASRSQGNMKQSVSEDEPAAIVEMSSRARAILDSMDDPADMASQAAWSRLKRNAASGDGAAAKLLAAYDAHHEPDSDQARFLLMGHQISSQIGGEEQVQTQIQTRLSRLA